MMKLPGPAYKSKTAQNAKTKDRNGKQPEALAEAPWRYVSGIEGSDKNVYRYKLMISFVFQVRNLQQRNVIV